MSSFTCLLFRVILFWESCELELTGWSSAESSFLLCSSTAKTPRIAAFILLPVKPIWIGTLGVLTTNEDSDLFFLLTGSEFVGVTSGASTFLLFRGKFWPLYLADCGLSCIWSTKNLKWEHMIAQSISTYRHHYIYFGIHITLQLKNRYLELRGPISKMILTWNKEDTRIK